MSQTQMKTYVLLDHMAPTAPIYLRVSEEKRVRIDKLPTFSPNLQYTFADKDGINKTVRLMLSSNTVYQEEQIKQGIPANEKFTTSERRAARFTNGVLMTNNKIVQEFLAVIPDNENFEGQSQTVLAPKFKEFKAQENINSVNKSFQNTVKAANKIVSLSLAGAQEMLYKIYGTHYAAPTDLAEAQNALVTYMDSSDEAVDEINKMEYTLDEEITIMLAKLVSAQVISFESIPGSVSRFKNKGWIGVKNIGGDLPHEERVRIFSEYLTTPAGLSLLADLRKDEEKLTTTLSQEVTKESTNELSLTGKKPAPLKP